MCGGKRLLKSAAGSFFIFFLKMCDGCSVSFCGVFLCCAGERCGVSDRLQNFDAHHWQTNKVQDMYTLYKPHNCKVIKWVWEGEKNRGKRSLLR